MKKLVLFIFILFLTAFGVFLVLQSYNLAKTEKIISNIGSPESDEDIKEEQETEIKAGEEGIEAGEGTGSEDADSASGCEEKQISYSIKDFNQISICSKYENALCIDKTINCSLKLENLDEEITGLFEIKFVFFNEDNEKLYSSISSFLLEPKTEKIIESIFNIKGEDAEEIICSYNTLKIPKKQIC